MSDKELQRFDKLKSAITQFFGPAKEIVVRNFTSADEATAAGKVVKSYLDQVEETRDALVRPLNAQVKLINEYAKNVKAPLIEVESHLKDQLRTFTIEQERVRQEELRRIEAERRDAERLAAEEAAKAQAEAEAKKQADLAALRASMAAIEPEPVDELGALFGMNDIQEADAATTAAFVEEERQRIEAQADEAKIDAQLKADRERAVRDAQFKEQAWDAGRKTLKNARTNRKAKLVDINLVPKEFLIITLNEKAATAALKAGAIIPGVELVEDLSINFGSKTYVPREAIENEQRG